MEKEKGLERAGVYEGRRVKGVAGVLGVKESFMVKGTMGRGGRQWGEEEEFVR